MQSLNDLSTFAATIQLRLDQSSWNYDPVSGRYRGANGRFLSQSAVESLVDGRINKLGYAVLQTCLVAAISRWINGSEA